MMSFKEYEGIVFDEGKNVGVAIGEAKRDAEHVKNMARHGFGIGDIAIALGMSETEVRNLLNKPA